MTAGSAEVSADWLALREPADARARAADLVVRAGRLLPADRPAVIHDLGCGTGSMGRWLAPQLSGRQHWVLHDRDPALLAVAVRDMPSTGARGEQISSETRRQDITRLDDDQLAGASLVTASALLDMLTAEELDRLANTCVNARCPVLLTLSVTGRVDLTPAHPLDGTITAGFNAHQRRRTAGGSLLGPDAVRAAVRAFQRLGAAVIVRESPWRLDHTRAALLAEWFAGWIRAACEQEPALGDRAAHYADGRTAQATAGRLLVTVHHRDLLVLPAGGAPTRNGGPAAPAPDDDRTPG